MSTTSALAAVSGYAGISRISAAALGRQRDTAEAASTPAAAAPSASVTISSAAREAARNDTGQGLKLPDAEYWMSRDFPEDIMAEARARLEQRQPAPGGGYLPDSVANLPLLPENEALLQQFRQEMKEIGHNNPDPEKQARFNRLLNLSMKVQIDGWKAPMTEADAQRELDISRAMGVLMADQPQAEPAAGDDTPRVWDPMAGWKTRWQQEGLEMPEVTEAATPQRSLWLQLAEGAGIAQDEFVARARELASGLSGNDLTRALEQFISDRYVAFRASQAGAAA